MRAKLLSFLTSLVAVLGFRGEVDSITGQVQTVYVSCRLQGFSAALRWMAPMVAIIQAYYYLLYHLRVLEPVDTANIHAMPTVLFADSVIGFHMLISLWPATLTPRSIDAFLACLMVVLGAMIVVDKQPLSLLVHLPRIIVARFTVSIAMNSMFVRLLANVGLTVVAFLSLSPIVQEPQNAFIIRNEITVALMILIVCSMIDACLYALARATVTSKALRRSEVMASSLLSTLCDAVVHLDWTLRICKPAPQLVALLLARLHNADLVGSGFLDLIEEVDRDQFARMTAIVAEAATKNCDHLDDAQIEPAKLMDAHLRDSSGTRMRVQLILAACLQLDDSINYIIGIREVGLEENLDLRALPSGPRPSQQQLYLQPESHGVLDNIGIDAESSGSDNTDSVADADSESTALSGAHRSNKNVMFTIDIESAGFPILECTPAFPFLGGPSPVGHRLLDWVTGTTGNELGRAVDSLAGIFLGRHDEGSYSAEIQREDLGVCTLRPAFAQWAGVKYHASCCVEFELMLADSSHDCEDWKLVVRMVISSLRRLDKNTRRRRKSGVSSTPPSETLIAGSLGSTGSQTSLVTALAREVCDLPSHVRRSL